MYIARNFLAALIVVVVAGTMVVLPVSFELLKRETLAMPDVSVIATWRPAATSVMLAADGTMIGRFATQNRIPVRLGDIPPLVASAFISAEDKAFRTHKGINPAAIVRAILYDLRSRGHGKRPIGASTIDQQVVKNLILGDQRTVRRKIQEAVLAVRLDRELGKTKVLETYLNEVYLGEGAYGVAAAAQAYFGKSLDQLDVADIALLAAMPKGPSNYDPVRHPAAARSRRAYVLSRMVEDGVITSKESKDADAKPLPDPDPRFLGGVADSYFAEEARRAVVARLGGQSLYRGGLVIETSMDPALQSLAERSLRDGLVGYDQRHGWRGPLASIGHSFEADDLVTWEHSLRTVPMPPGAAPWQKAVVLSSARDAVLGLADGSRVGLPVADIAWARPLDGTRLGAAPRMARQVLSKGDVVLVEQDDHGFHLRQIPLVQGALVAIEAATGRVLAVAGGFSHEQGDYDRVTQSQRQPGSTFKPFIYLAALEKGFDATSPLLDMPISIDAGGGAPIWEPGSDGDSGMGLIPLRKALEMSRNFASVRLLYDLGLPVVSDVTARFGLYPTLPNYAAALGALETSPLRLTSAYAMIANGGHFVSPTFVDKVLSSDSVELWHRPRFGSKTVSDPDSIARLRSILEGVVNNGTAARALGGLKLPLAGKTGTTNDNVDAWFVGFSPDIAVGVHVGFDRSTSLGPKEFGAVAAAPIFGAFMKEALAKRPPTAGAFISIPDARRPAIH